MHTVVLAPPAPSPSAPPPPVPAPRPRPGVVPLPPFPPFPPGPLKWFTSGLRRRHAVVLALLLLAGCATADANPDATPAGALGSSDPPSEAAVAVPGQVAVTAVDFGFDLPDRLPAGPTRLSLSNDGAEPHHAQLARLADGVDEDTFRAALETTDDARIAEVAVFAGGTGVVVPGGTSEADGIVDLEEGTYALLCFIPGAADGVPHYANGMVAFVDVDPSDDTPVPSDDSPAISMGEYDFALPDDELTAGTWTVTNDGGEPHEMNVLRLADGATLEDVLAAEPGGEGPPPGLPVGGVNAIVPGTTARVSLDLPAGRYALVCYVPTFADGIPHVAKGMIREVTIVE